VQLDGGHTGEALGIEVVGGMFVPLIDRGTAVPCQRTEIFTTADDGQSQIKVTVYRGNAGMVAQNQRVGVFEVSVPNPGARGTASIAVTFDIDPRGAFRLLAVDQATGLPAPVTTTG
jgi:molecular chaperone DnaK